MALEPVLFAVSVSAVAAWIDWQTGRIPNWLTAGSAVVGLLLKLSPLVGAFEVTRLLSLLMLSVFGALLCSVVPLLLFWKGGIGGGDVKLFAAIGLICPPEIGLLAQTYSFIVALLLAPAWLAYRGTLLRTLSQAAALATNPFRRPEKRRQFAPADLAWFRLGPAIFVGTALAALRGALLR